MFDTTGLTEVKMRKSKNSDWHGSFFLRDDQCLAKTCSSCRQVKPSDQFRSSKGHRYLLQPNCYECNRNKCRSFNKDPDTGDVARGIRNNARTWAQVLQDRARIRPYGWKRCTNCQETKSLDSYYNNRGRDDGLNTLCIDCKKVREAERRAQRYKKHWTATGVPFDQCIYCQMMTDLTTGDLHGDHVIARKLGGPDEMSNIAPACYACNICKGSDTLEEFLAREFFYEEDREEIRERLAAYGYLNN